MRPLRSWLSDVRQLLPLCGAFLGVVLVCGGIVYGNHYATKPTSRTQIELERENTALKAENLALKLLLDERRRAEGKAPVFGAGADNIPATNLPTTTKGKP